TGLQGFWLAGDFATYGDGAETASTASDQILPLVTNSTGIYIANVNVQSITVTVRLFARNGSEIAPPVTQSIVGRALFGALPSTLFPSADFSQAGHIRVTSTGAFAATSVVGGFL